MRVTSDNKVGIGTTTPSEKLSVNGNIDLSGTLNCSGCVSSLALAPGVSTAIRSVAATPFDALSGFVGGSLVTLTCNAPFEVISANTDDTESASSITGTIQVDQDGTGTAFAPADVSANTAISVDPAGGGADYTVSFNGVAAGTDGTVSFVYATGTPVGDTANVAFIVLTSPSATCSVTTP